MDLVAENIDVALWHRLVVASPAYLGAKRSSAHASRSTRTRLHHLWPEFGRTRMALSAGSSETSVYLRMRWNWVGPKECAKQFSQVRDLR